MTDIAKKSPPALVVALDVPSAREAEELTNKLSGLPLWFKIGLELFTAEGPALVRKVLADDFSVFLDLKFHDIPNTVQRVTKVASNMGVHMATLHLSGGEAMARAAVEGRRQALESNGENAQNTLLMGVTVLTSQGATKGSNLADLVVGYAQRAKEWGLDGVVCSGQEAAAVKAACGDDFYCLCPGIRFSGEAGGDDQARVTTPEQAVMAGANFLVMGRPITQAADPFAQASKAISLMNAAF